jgi:proteasome lid subunit RPN8/RPN11
MTAKPWEIVGDTALVQMREHALAHPNEEIGGVLVGLRGDRQGMRAHAVAAISAEPAVGDRTRLTFTHDAWEHIHRVLEEEYPDEDIIGWYHSHPGHGIFLSEHDTFIHRNFFSAPWQVAVVVDPVRLTEGIFVWVDGDVRLVDERPVEHAAPAPTAEDEHGRASPAAEPVPARPRFHVILDEPEGSAPPVEPDVITVRATPREAPAPGPAPVPVAAADIEAREPEHPARRRRTPREPYPVIGHLVPVTAGLTLGALLAILLS